MPTKAVRRVAVVTGTRAEYGLLRTVMRSIDAHADLELQVIVTGMHLLQRYGYTIDEIRRDGWTIDATVEMQGERDDALEQVEGLARGVAGIGRELERLNPDIVLVLGDRIEAFAAASATIALRRILAHVHGGDVATGDVDDALRHAITKLAHLHFPAAREAGKRIKHMGEDEWRIHVVGAPGLDELRDVIRREGGIELDSDPNVPDREFAMITRHPCTRSATEERKITRRILRAVRAENLAALAIYPNTDPGNSGVIDAVEQAAQEDEIRTFASLPRATYLDILRRATVMVGNSSSGMIEAPFLGTPVVNVGSRQEGRLRGGPAILDSEEDYESIRRAIRQARSMRCKPGARSAYGDGTAGERIASVLSEVELDQRLRFKRITY